MGVDESGWEGGLVWTVRYVYAVVAGGWLVVAPGVFEKLSLYEAVLEDGHGHGHGHTLSLLWYPLHPLYRVLSLVSLHRATLNPVGPVTYRLPPFSFLLSPSSFLLPHSSFLIPP